MFKTNIKQKDFKEFNDKYVLGTPDSKRGILLVMLSLWKPLVLNRPV